jgi:hypothetical protein
MGSDMAAETGRKTDETRGRISADEKRGRKTVETGRIVQDWRGAAGKTAGKTTRIGRFARHTRNTGASASAALQNGAKSAEEGGREKRGAGRARGLWHHLLVANPWLREECAP